ncbi:MAG TPA: hypothetical protein VFY21_02195 [Xanthobacteraceae bacterium]|nr:hypothetical protein [Xanthobacteraceae bacterium]
MNTLQRANISGGLASVAIALTLAVLARREGKRALQPINATSHWLHGKPAGRVRKADASHTLVGYLTHHASAVFWAYLFERWLGRRRRGILAVVPRAAAMSGIAAAVDYGVVPRRLTPGWEHVVSNRSLKTAYVVMGLALAAGALLQGQSGKPR